MKPDTQTVEGNQRPKDRVFTVGLILAVLVLALGAPWNRIQWAVTNPKSAAVSVGNLIRVEVRGFVKLEGVYEVPEGATVREFLSDRVGADGIDRVTSDDYTPVSNDELKDLSVLWVHKGSQGPAVTVRPMSAAEAFVLGEPLDLNRADTKALQLLPGIGPVGAKRITDDRRNRGPFGSPADLGRVRGISSKTLEGLEGLVSAD